MKCLRLVESINGSAKSSLLVPLLVTASPIQTHRFNSTSSTEQSSNGVETLMNFPEFSDILSEIGG